MLYTARDNKEGTQLFFSALLDSRCVEFKYFIVLIYGTFTYSSFFTLTTATTKIFRSQKFRIRKLVKPQNDV